MKFGLEINDYNDIDIENLNIKKRTLNCFIGEGIKNVRDVLKYGAYGLLKIPGFGYISLFDISSALKKYNIEIDNVDKVINNMRDKKYLLLSKRYKWPMREHKW